MAVLFDAVWGLWARLDYRELLITLTYLFEQVFAECGLSIRSHMSVGEFKEVVLGGTYAMRTELDSTSISKGYERMGLIPK